MTWLGWIWIWRWSIVWIKWMPFWHSQVERHMIGPQNHITIKYKIIGGSFLLWNLEIFCCCFPISSFTPHLAIPIFWFVFIKHLFHFSCLKSPTNIISRYIYQPLSSSKTYLTSLLHNNFAALYIWKRSPNKIYDQTLWVNNVRKIVKNLRVMKD